MTDAPAAPETRGTLRARLMWAMVLLAGLSLAASGAIVAVVQDASISANLDAQLGQNRDELRILAESGVDPSTGEPFAGPSELLGTYLQRTVVGPGEGEVAFVGPDIRWVASEDVRLRPEDDAELMAAVAPWVTGDEIVFERIATTTADYHVLVVPVHFPTETGALVSVFDRAVAEEQLRRTMTIYTVVAVVTLAIVVFLAWLAVGRLLRPIEQLREAADSIDEHDLTTRVPVRGNDDLTALSATINSMLDRVQRSVEGQRRLLDDVGHELRTPITVVRGQMEVVDADDPADVRQTRDLVVDEVDRMSGLVDDLLTLAKAGESDFVRPRWSDVAVLTDQTLEKARALGDRRWSLDEVASAEAWLDPARVTQAWLELAANAVKYSDQGSTVTIGSRLDLGTVRLWVRDQGIGIRPDELALVRERFGRAREAVLHSPGSGLGLNIVESIVAAHGGGLDIDSEPGVGSTFTITLPGGPRQVAEESR